MIYLIESANSNNYIILNLDSAEIRIKGRLETNRNVYYVLDTHFITKLMKTLKITIAHKIPKDVSRKAQCTLQSTYSLQSN